MNAEDLDLIREKILLLCRAANIQGLRADRILRTIQRCGWDADEAAVARELTKLHEECWRGTLTDVTARQLFIVGLTGALAFYLLHQTKGRRHGR